MGLDKFQFVHEKFVQIAQFFFSFLLAIYVDNDAELSHLQTIFSKDSFVKTRALPEDVIAGWRPKVIG